MSKFIIKDLYDEHTNLSNFFYLNYKKLIFNGKEIKNGRINNYKTDNLYNIISKEKDKIHLVSYNPVLEIYISNYYDSCGKYLNYRQLSSYKNIEFMPSGIIQYYIKDNIIKDFDIDLPRNIFEWTEEDMFYYELLMS